MLPDEAIHRGDKLLVVRFGEAVVKREGDLLRLPNSDACSRTRRNEADAPVISREGSSATVRVMRTDESLMLARHTRALVEKSK